LRLVDTSPSIPAEIRERIFELSFTAKKEDERTGPGLYVCPNIIAEDEGRLTWQVGEGKKAIFRIVLSVGRCLKKGQTLALLQNI